MKLEFFFKVFLRILIEKFEAIKRKKIIDQASKVKVPKTFRR